MLSRSVILGRALKSAVGRTPAVARCMSGYGPSHWRSDKTIDLDVKAMMDFLPIPEGSWSNDYKNNQSKYNIQLLISATATVATAYGMYHFGCFDIDIHPAMKNE